MSALYLRRVAAVDAAALLRFELEHRAYFERIPVVVVDGELLCEYDVSEALVRERLESRR